METMVAPVLDLGLIGFRATGCIGFIRIIVFKGAYGVLEGLGGFEHRRVFSAARPVLLRVQGLIRSLKVHGLGFVFGT